MTNKKINKKILHIGPLPPPLGGVSIYIARLIELQLLDSHDITVFNESSLKSIIKNIKIYKISDSPLWWIKKIFQNKFDIVHCHSNSWNIRFWVVLFKLTGSKVFISYHSLRDDFFNFSKYKKFKVSILIRLADMHLVVSDEIRKKLLSWHCFDNRVRRFDNFLPPSKDEFMFPINDNIKTIAQTADPLVIANASALKFYKHQDLYGIDMMLELTSRLIMRYHNIVTIIFLGTVGDDKYFKQLNRQIGNLGLNEHFFFVINNAMIPVLANADLFIRPTNTDGIGISISEALSVGIPTIASDVCERPDGCTLFSSRDIEDLETKCLMILNNKNGFKKEHKLNMDFNNTIKPLNIISNLYKT